MGIENLMQKQGTHLYEHVFVNIGNLKPNQGKHPYQHVLVNIGYLIPNQGDLIANESKTYANMVVKNGVLKVGVLIYIVYSQALSVSRMNHENTNVSLNSNLKKFHDLLQCQPLSMMQRLSKSKFPYDIQG